MCLELAPRGHSSVGVNLRELMYMIEVDPSQLDNYIVNNTLHVNICKAWEEQADQQCLAACHTIVESLYIRKGSLVSPLTLHEVEACCLIFAPSDLCLSVFCVLFFSYSYFFLIILFLVYLFVVVVFIIFLFLFFLTKSVTKHVTNKRI
jgi:hypothetical protein